MQQQMEEEVERLQKSIFNFSSVVKFATKANNSSRSVVEFQKLKEMIVEKRCR